MALIPEPLDLHSEIQPGDVKFPPDIPTDLTALKIVLGDMSIAENYVYENSLYSAWARADRLYEFYVPMYFWEGTTQPRAHLGVPLVYEHVNSLLPQAVDSLFFDNPPFAVFPRPGTGMPAARANQHILSWELEETHFKQEIESFAESCLLYGTGIGKWGWISSTETRKMLRQSDPADIDSLEEREEVAEVNRPTFEALDIRTVFPDPALTDPDIRKARYVIHRIYMTIAELDGLREVDGYDIPSQSTLVSYFFPPKESVPGPRATTSADPLDKLKGIAGLPAEFASEDPTLETSVDPLNKPLEVLEYWTNDRCITVLQRKLVIRNEANYFGAIPFCSCVFGRVPNSFWGFGIAKLVGPEQRLQQGVINARLDNLSLSLNGMFVRVRGANAPTQQVRMRPGGVIDVDRENGITLLQPGLDLSNAFAEVAASDQRAERRSGASQFLTQGTIPASGASALSKAAGVNALAGGASARIQRFVERMSDLVFIPVLESFTVMNRLYLKPTQIQHILANELGQAFNAQPLDILNARLEFQMLAGGKLQARQAMASTLPVMLQFLINEPMMRALAEQGKKVDFGEVVNMLYDVSRWPNQQSLIVPMSQEDTARNAMNNPAVQQMMAEQQRSEQAGEMTEMKSQAQAGRDTLRAILKNAFETNQGQEVAQ